MNMSRINREPKVSVIIPTCKRAKLLLECVESILSNGFMDFEILVIDQDPNQSLRGMLSSRFNQDPRINYLFLAEPALDKARNLGVDSARGDILVFADDDIEVESGWLQAYLYAFSSISPPPGVVGGRLDPLWMSPRPKWLPKECECLLGIYNKGDQLIPMPGEDLPIGANFAVSRKAIEMVGKFDERIDYSYARRARMIAGGDSLFSLRVKQAGLSIYYQPQAKARHKISDNKLTRRHLLRRNFWGGVTTVIVLYLATSIRFNQFPGIIRVHFREIGGQVWRAVFPRARGVATPSEGRSFMRLAASCANSLGVIYCSAMFLWTRRVPFIS